MYLHAVIVLVGDNDVVSAVHGHASGPVELTRIRASLSERVFERPIGVKYLKQYGAIDYISSMTKYGL